MKLTDLIEEDLEMSSSDVDSEASDFDEDLDPDKIEVPGIISIKFLIANELISSLTNKLIDFIRSIQ